MGCCLAPVSARPGDPSIVVYGAASRMLTRRSDMPFTTFQAGRGLASVKGDLLDYIDGWGRRRMGVYLKDIQKVSVERAFVDRGLYMLPCYCCTCTGCPDGIVDIRGTMTEAGGGPQGMEFHIGIEMPGAEEFADKLNAEIRKTSSQDVYKE